jgi:hypothetical protein
MMDYPRSVVANWLEYKAPLAGATDPLSLRGVLVLSGLIGLLGLISLGCGPPL